MRTCGSARPWLSALLPREPAALNADQPLFTWSLHSSPRSACALLIINPCVPAPSLASKASHLLELSAPAPSSTLSPKPLLTTQVGSFYGGTSINTQIRDLQMVRPMSRGCTGQGPRCSSLNPSCGAAIGSTLCVHALLHCNDNGNKGVRGHLLRHSLVKLLCRWC